MFVLPQILLIGDRIIEKTTFDVAMPVRMREESGTVVVNGTIRGTVNGTVIGVMNAVVRGDVKAVIVSGSMEKAEEKALPEFAVDAEEEGPVSAGEGADEEPNDGPYVTDPDDGLEMVDLDED